MYIPKPSTSDDFFFWLSNREYIFLSVICYCVILLASCFIRFIFWMRSVGKYFGNYCYFGYYYLVEMMSSHLFVLLLSPVCQPRFYFNIVHLTFCLVWDVHAFFFFYCNNIYCSIKPLKLVNIKKNFKNVTRFIFMSYTEVGIIGRCFLCIRRGWRVSKSKYWAYWIWCPCNTFRWADVSIWS